MSEIYLHNTLSGEKEEFTPIKAGVVSMYNCGPTVYNYAHVGNLRSFIMADTLRRMFEYNGYEVKQVMNVTDIGHLSSDSDDGEDKMTKALKREGKPMTLEAMREVADFYFAEFRKNLEDLNFEMPEEFPFASDNIQENIDLVLRLQEKGFIYPTSDGLYFDTAKFPEYGKLGNIHLGETDQSRIGSNPEKHNQRDFAVWKFNQELGYEAPFGKGFPGWHIECSAMSVKYLGPEFDVHTGGIDHIPVHHQNEIAQAVCAGYPYARYWVHNAFYNIGEEKMAKSGENFITLETLKEKGLDPVALRYVFLTSRYSSPLQFSWEALEGAETAIKKLRALKNVLNKVVEKSEGPMHTEELSPSAQVYKDKILEYINDDLDTPKLLALMWEVSKDERLVDLEKRHLLWNIDKILGLDMDKAEVFSIPEKVQALATKREEARLNKDFSESDRLRNEIEAQGFIVRDTADGPLLEPK